MSVSQFSAMSTTRSSSEAFVQYSSLSRFIEFGSRNRRSKKLLLTRTSNFRPLTTTSFCVKNVSSEPKANANVKEPVVEEGLYFSLCSLCCLWYDPSF